MGTVRADTIADGAGTGAPNFSQGLQIAGGSIDAYEIDSVAVTGSGFSGNLGLVRLGAMVIATAESIWPHNNGGTPSTDAIIPAAFRPTDIISQTYNYDANSGMTVNINTDGTMTFLYRDETGAVNRTDIFAVFSVAYKIT